ncbi:ABC transporter permease [Luteibacter yeojuensis]|uniref:ABC transporter permease n=1 Tax=Luteibacter yeojuensis TaxID=345309 RepID=A0A7X5QSQ7_9GAMM|nr:ABC transporter permease [Luteibacter yeojuensis]NID14725.1 ABC transporter permease [Luteibacter yeojuensis]
MSGLPAFLRRVANLCLKELKVILKDPASRVVLFAPVLVQSLMFGYAATLDLRQAPYALLDQDHGQAATRLVARIEGSGVFRRVATLRNESDIAPIVNAGKVLFVVNIPPRFEQRLEGGESAPVQLILDARNSSTAGTAAGYLGTIVSRFNADWRREHGGGSVPLTLDVRSWYNPNLETRWFMMTAMIAILSMLQTLMLTALSVAREREQGTFDQLLVTPCTPAEIMIGKSVPSIVVGLVQASLVLLIATLWFRIPMAGSLGTLYVALLVFMVACVGIGLAISAMAASMQQAMLYTFVLMMPLVLLSGMTTPIANMPVAMQWLTAIDPARYAIHMVQRVYLEGVGLGTVLGDILPLLGIASVTLPLAAWLFRNRLV